MLSSKALIALLPFLASTFAAPTIGKKCVSTISSFSDVAKAVSSGCTSITLNTITVPAGTALDLSGLADGTTVDVQGDVTFTGGTEWAGPMFIIDGEGVTFNGNGHTFDGQGQTYWDGLGGNGGKTKPKMMKIKNSGTFTNLIVKNTPVQAFSVGSNSAALTISKITIDNRAGDALGSNKKALGHNTDCFDVSATGVTLTGNTCYNQDDCLAINAGSNIVFSNNYCSGGHGISIGSIQSNKVVSGVTITNNQVVDSTNGLRIKTVSGATGGSVSDVTYSGNVITGATSYGIVIQQDYENGSPTGTPTNGIKISDISFTSGNTVSAASGGDEVYVLCGSGSCTGTWNWSGLTVSGGDKGSITGNPPITGFTLGQTSPGSGAGASVSKAPSTITSTKATIITSTSKPKTTTTSKVKTSKTSKVKSTTSTKKAKSTSSTKVKATSTAAALNANVALAITNSSLIATPTPLESATSITTNSTSVDDDDCEDEDDVDAPFPGLNSTIPSNTTLTPGQVFGNTTTSPINSTLIADNDDDDDSDCDGDDDDDLSTSPTNSTVLLGNGGSSASLNSTFGNSTIGGNTTDLTGLGDDNEDDDCEDEDEGQGQGGFGGLNSTIPINSTSTSGFGQGGNATTSAVPVNSTVLASDDEECEDDDADEGGEDLGLSGVVGRDISAHGHGRGGWRTGHA